MDDPTTEIARRAVGGDEDAISVLVSKFHPPLLALARRRISQRLKLYYQPEDLVADTWMVALPRLAEFDPLSGRMTPRVIGFLSRTLVNRSNTLLQKHCLGKPMQADDDQRHLLVGSIRGPLTAAMVSEDHEQVHRALDALDAGDQEIICLRGLQQLAHGDVARLLGITAQNARVRYFRALQRLAAELPNSLFPELLEDAEASPADAARV